ncbi:MAG: hypothetical protein AAF391_02580, partial [Bacteroidota bacterium]
FEERGELLEGISLRFSLVVVVKRILLNLPNVGTIQIMTIDFTNDYVMGLNYYNQDVTSFYSATLD